MGATDSRAFELASDGSVVACTCCGSRDFAYEKVLWPSLIREWGLSEHEVNYIDRQQGLRCRSCGSNLRTMALALAICRCYGHEGTLAGLVQTPQFQSLRVLEINEAGGLTQFLSRVPAHVLARYPEVDMMRMPYAEASFDLVLHSETLEHVTQPVIGLSECHRVLAPGGHCAFTIPVIVDRMTRSRVGLPAVFHNNENEQSADLAVQTEYGCDAWKHVIAAGFDECRLIVAEFPSALAFVGVRRRDGALPSALDDNCGERMVPETSGASTFWEHVFRYAFACRFATGKRLLDVACGEGYGAAALAKAGAAQVIGLDISEAACRHARWKYGLDARSGSAEELPLPDESLDLIVSFETIEHVSSPGRFLDECARVLAPGGMIIMSTPNREVYTDRLGAQNPHHRSEMNEGEFETAFRSRFKNARFYTQSPNSAVSWSPRSLLCDGTMWERIKGFRRIRQRIQRRTLGEPDWEKRQTIVDVILQAARTQRPLLNQFAVRPRHNWHHEKSVYVLATGVR